MPAHVGFKDSRHRLTPSAASCESQGVTALPVSGTRIRTSSEEGLRDTFKSVLSCVHERRTAARVRRVNVGPQRNHLRHHLDELSLACCDQWGRSRRHRARAKQQ